MGISFKVSRTGRRVHPRPIPRSGGDASAAAEKSDDFPDDVVLGSSKKSGDSVSASSLAILPDTEASFTLSLYQDGYTVGKVSEVESANQTYCEIPKLLHPYDRASETLFSAIEAGRLPGDILDDLPCKYVNGGLVCEVRDYRKCFSDTGIILPAATNSPVIQKLHLRMSLENVVKDMPSISDGAWTYGDMMEVESRILKALQPKLCLDPTPKLDRLGENTISTKLNLGLRNMRKRLRQIPDVTVTNNIRGKKVCIDGVPESSRFGDSGFAQPLHENQPTQSNGPNSMIALRSNSGYGANASVPSSHQMAVGSPRVMQDHRPGPILSAPGASHSGQDMVITYSDNAVPGAAALQVRRDGQDVLPNSNKRPRNTSVSGYGNQQHMGSPMDGFQGQDPNWKNTVLQQQSLVRGIQYGNTGMQKYPLPIFEGGSNQEPGSQFVQGMQFGLKEEQFEMDKQGLGQNRNEVHGLESELNQNDSQQIRLAQRVPQQVMSSTFPQIPWNNLGQPLESNTRKDDPYQKRKIVQSPRVSAGVIPQSPLSSRSGEFSSGSVGHQVGGAVTSGYLQPQKEKAGNMSVHPLGGGTSMTSSANDSMPRHHQAQMVSKRRSNSLPKNPAMSGVGSPASVSNMSMPINVGSPPVGSPPLSDPVVIDRFSKIEMVTARFQLNSKKTKVEEHPARKLFSPQQLARQFSNDLNNENFKDDSCTMPMSKSLVGGSMNVCKTRVLCFMLSESNAEGNGFPVPKARTRLIMSEKPTDGTVAFHMGDIEDNQYLSAEDYLPTLPNTHTADLLAAQFYSLMVREGYQVEDHVQPKPTPPIHTVSNQHCAPGGNPYNAAGESQSQQYSDGVSGHPLNDANKQPSSNNLQGQRMLGPGTAQGLQISQDILSAAGMPPRPQQPDPTASQQQNQVNQHMQNQVNQQMQNQVMQNQVNQVNQQMQNQVNQVNQQMQNQVSQQQMTPSQQAQLQRNLALASNPVLNAFGQNSNAQLNNYVTNNSSHLQLQMLQQQQAQKQQQQQILQRKMMNIGNAGLGNMANSIGGYGGIGNMMGLGGVRGVGGAGISAPMGSIAGMGNMGQNPLNLGASPNTNNVLSQQQLRPGGMNPIHHIMSKIRMGQNSGNMNLPVVGQAGMRGGISGARQMQMNTATTGLPMLGAAMNRGNINTMQRPMGQMRPPKLVSGNNTYFTPQQVQQMQQQQHQHLQQQQQQMQQQLQQQQQQDNASSLQSVLTATQVGSPSNMGISQQVNQPNNQQQQLQQPSPQQMSQRTPMSPQLSSGAVHTMSAGNQEPAPPSPQLSSQTMNSVGSITNSPMDLQGVNKSN